MIDELAELRAENAALREALAATLDTEQAFPAGWRLSAQQATVLATLAAHGFASHNRLAAALWGGPPTPLRERQLRVLITRLRDKIAPPPLILCRRGVGYGLDPSDRARFLAFCAPRAGPASPIPRVGDGLFVSIADSP